MQVCLKRILLTLVTIASSVYAGPDVVPIPDKIQIPILNPALAQRKTAKIRLANGVEAYLVSDPGAEKSAAAMVVKVGSWEDPDEVPGMAHFVEHMLFMGTKKYPEESSFQRYISEHGGTTNASTASDQTTYLFSVESDVFPEALDRFASFFREPLFNPSGVSREIQAIDQEFARIARSDEGRTMLVLQSLNNPKHPNSRFTVGDRRTLTPATQEELVKWYQEHYSANLMRLVVYSSLDLDTLKKLVTSDFLAIPNKDRQRPHFTMPMYDKDMLGTMSYIESLMDSRTVTLRWELPAQFANMKDRKPDSIVCYVLGHEGEHSLLAQLKEEGYAEALGCGGDSSGEDSYIAYLQITLTKKGLKEVDQVLQRTFQAIDGLRAKAATQYLFDEVQRSALLSYQYQERQEAYEYVTKLAYAVGDEDMSTFPVESFTIQNYDPKGILSFVEYLTPKNAHITVRAPANYLDRELDRTEKWAGAKFTMRPVPREQLAQWQHLEKHRNLDIPAQNLFMPKDLGLVATKKAVLPQPQPIAIVNNDHARLYYALDEFYQVPQAYVFLQFQSPEIHDGDSRKAVLLDLYVKSLQEALKSSLYPAEMAGLETQIGTKKNAFGIELSGYSDHTAHLLKEVLDTLKVVKPTAEQFAKYKETLAQDYRNFSKESPLAQAAEAISAIIYKDYSTHLDKLHVVQRVTLQDLENYITSLWKESFVSGIFYGNLTEDTAKEMASLVEQSLEGTPYPKDQRRSNAVLDMSGQAQPSYVVVKGKTTGNAAILAIENMPYSPTLQGAQNVLSKGISTPFFDALRTRQQTGYAVGNWDQEIQRHLFLLFAVESDSHDGRDLLARFELFFEDFLRELGISELTDPQFRSIAEAVVRELDKPAQNLKAMGQILGTLAVDYDGDFDWIKKRIEALKALSYPEFIKLTREMLSTNNRKRLGVIFKGTSSDAKNVLEYQPVKGIRELRSQMHYKARKET